jgi:hypothetical protein
MPDPYLGQLAPTENQPVMSFGSSEATAVRVPGQLCGRATTTAGSGRRLIRVEVPLAGGQDATAPVCSVGQSVRAAPKKHVDLPSGRECAVGSLIFSACWSQYSRSPGPAYLRNPC